MRILAFDPGALRMGWALLESGPQYLGSGIQEFKRNDDEAYQEYRLRLVEFWADKSRKMIRACKPDAIVSEIVPVKGFSDPSQSLLAGSAITAVQCIAASKKIPNYVVAAQSVKATMGNKKATKVQVREAVIKALPELEDRRKSWTKVFDESDAIAIALHFLRTNK